MSQVSGGVGTVRVLENKSDPIIASTVTSQLYRIKTYARTTHALRNAHTNCIVLGVAE